MKILLTAKPRMGKTTVIQRFVKSYKGTLTGILSLELRDAQNERVGFEGVTLQGQHRIFAHRFLFKSKYIVGGKYFVDIDAIDTFMTGELQKGLRQKSGVILMDEIGRIEAFSSSFLKTCLEIVNSDCDLLGTIVLDDEVWAMQFKQHSEVVLIMVSETNRDVLPGLLATIFENCQYLKQLSDQERSVVLSLTRDYFSTDSFIQLEKLFKHAIRYFSEKKVHFINTNDQEKIFEVLGDHDVHRIIEKQQNIYICDCDLFNGKGIYESSNGECSHIQAVKMLGLNVSTML